MNPTLLQTMMRRVEAQAADGPRALGDAELLRRFAATRDEAAFNVLVARHGPLVWAVCRNLLPTEAEAEDAFQVTFLALIESAQRVRTPAVGAWLHGVAVRVARMAKRSAGRRRQRERKAALREAATPVADASWAELQAAVHEEVGRLAEPLRVAFVLCGLQGKSPRDVAAELGWKAGTLSGRLTKARQQLLQRLSRRGVAAGAVAAALVGGSAAGIAAAPAGLVARVAELAGAGLDLGTAASPNLLELARAATEVTMTRTKLFLAALCGLVVVGLTLLPLSSAQEKRPLGGAPAGGKAADAPGSTASDDGRVRKLAAAWEYKYVVRTSKRLDEFQRTLATHAAGGWEYVGTEADLASEGGPVMVFKRPTGAGRMAGGSLMGSGGMGGPGLGGFAGFGGPGALGGGGFGGMMGTPGGFAGAGPPDPRKPAANPPPSGSSRKGLPSEPSSPGAGDAAAGTARAARGPAPERVEVAIIRLRHAVAADVAKTLQDLFRGTSTRIYADQQSNSLLIDGDRATYDTLVKLMERLDKP